MSVQGIPDVTIRAADNGDCERVMALVFGELAEYSLSPDPEGEDADSHARRQGFQFITLEMINVLKEAIRLYTRFGFVPVAAKEVSARVDQAFLLHLSEGTNTE